MCDGTGGPFTLMERERGREELGGKAEQVCIEDSVLLQGHKMDGYWLGLLFVLPKKRRVLSFFFFFTCRDDSSAVFNPEFGAKTVADSKRLTSFENFRPLKNDTNSSFYF